MAKKRSHQVEAVKAPLQLTGSAVHQRTLREADAVWTKALEDAGRNYDQAMHGAWSRYMSALKIHQDTNGVKAKSGETDFDKKFDQERESALRSWNLAAAAADKNLMKVRDRVGYVVTDQTE